MKWSLAVFCVKEGIAAWPLTDSAAYTLHCAQQLVVPSAHVGCMAATSLELPARFDPSHVTTTWPLASAATHGKTLDFPSVPSRLTRMGDVHVFPRSEDEERKIFWLSDHTV